MAFDQYGYICHFNQECRCQVADCDYCGWNPDVSERRLEQFLHGNQDKEETTVKKIVNLNPIIKELADWCLVTKGLECSILGTVIDRLRAAPALDAVEVPCKMGDIVWGIKKFHHGQTVKQGTVYQMFFADDMRLCICVKNVCRGEWGKNVFATKEEAVAAIAERRTDQL